MVTDKKKDVLALGIEYPVGYITGDTFSSRSAAREWVTDYQGAKVIRVKVQKYVKK